jgi:hypothetical protein
VIVAAAPLARRWQKRTCPRKPRKSGGKVIGPIEGLGPMVMMDAED